MNNNEIRTTEQDEKVMADFKKFLGLEHFGWKLGAILVLVSAIILIILSIVFIAIGASVNSQTDFAGFPGVILGVSYLIVSLIALLPAAIISFIMIKKVEYYQSTLDTDISIARTRCTSVGMMVFFILFNTIAAIFFIINFVKTKNNAEAFDRIAAAQKN